MQMVCKSLHGLSPEYSSSKFENRETAAKNLRNSENIFSVAMHCSAKTITKIALAKAASFFGNLTFYITLGID